MTGIKEARLLWQRARESRNDMMEVSSANGKANRAYYAAFYAVSALLALDGVEFKKHQAVETAVHRDLVKTGRWPKELGQDYSRLFALRLTGDYGIVYGVSAEEASEAAERAERILVFVKQSQPDIFPE